MEKIVGKLTVECIQGDIVQQDDMDAVVNAANAALRSGGGVAGAIHRAAGVNLFRECIPLAPIKTGAAVITGGYNLPNKYVIHCLGPVYGVDKPEDKLLMDCYQNALNLAEKNQIESIAFPAISTGAFGYPVEEAAKIALDTIKKNAFKLKHVKKIKFILHSDSNLLAHCGVLESL